MSRIVPLRVMSRDPRTGGIALLSRLQIHIQNTIRPISRLPPEILLEIFSLVVAEWQPELLWDHQRVSAAFGTPIHIPSYTWLLIAHVCRYWRDIAVQSPKLWTTVIINQSGFLSTVLVWSQSLPISLYLYIQRGHVDYSDEEQLQIRDLLSPHLHRVTRLQIVSADYSHNLGGALSSCHFSSIREITVTMVNAPRRQNYDLDHHEELFRGWTNPEYDGLRRLSFARITLPGIRAAIRPNLRYLSIYLPIGDIELPKFLSVIERTPLLETLSIATPNTYFMPPVEALLEPHKIVTLPHLRSLQINSSRLFPPNIMQHLSYPNITSISLDLSDLDDLETDPDALADHLISSFPNDLRCLSLRANRNVCRLSAWKESVPDQDLRDPSVSAPYTIRIHLDNIYESRVSAWTFDCLASRLFTDSLETLALDIDFLYFVEIDIPVSLNEYAPNLRRLSISTMLNLSCILLPDHEIGLEKYSYIPIPRLTHLWIDRVEEMEDCLIDSILCKRKASGSVLEVLSVPECNDSYEMTAGLVGKLEIRDTGYLSLSDHLAFWATALN